MNKALKQRIEKLERQFGIAGFETKLRALARGLGGNEEAYLRAARGHQRQLGQALGEDGTITWEGLLLLIDLLESSHPSSPTPAKAADEPDRPTSWTWPHI